MAWLYRQKESRFWWIGYRANGKQILRSTGFEDRADADKELEKLNAIESAQKAGRLTEEFYRMISGSTLPAMSLQAALEKWLSECKGTTKPSTQAAYRTLATQFEEHLKANAQKPLLSEIKRDDVFSFLSDLAAIKAASTANNRRKVLSVFFCWAISHHYITSNPVDGVKRFKSSKVDRVERRAFSLAEMEQICNQAPNDFWRYMSMGGYYTGLRMADLICLRKKEVKLEQNHLRLEAFKVAGKVITIPLAYPFRQILENRITGLGRLRESDFLWPEQAQTYLKKGGKNNSGYFSNEFYKLILQPLGLVKPRKDKQKAKDGRNVRRVTNDVSFHSLRHTFISMLKVTGASQSVAKELAGHSSDAVNDLYTHTPIDVITRAINLLPEVKRET